MEPLSKGHLDELRRWFRNAEALSILFRIAESRVKQAQAKALEDAMKSNDANQLMDRANASLQEAKEWQTFLDKLRSITDENPPLETAIVS